MYTFEDLKNAKRLVVYGAGGTASDVINLLTSINTELEIYVVVTDKRKGDKNLLGHRVLGFEEAKDILRSNLVIIAMMECQKVEAFLANEGIYNVINVFQLRDILYLDLYKEPIQNDVILFTNFNGKGYGGNPKYICEKIRNQYKCIWAVENENEIMPEGIRKVLYGSYDFYRWLSIAKVWVDNDHKNVLSKKREHQYYIQTWHGSGPLKIIEHDAEALSSGYLKMSDMDVAMIDLFLSPSAFNTDQVRRAFRYKGDILECGLPRNDILINGIENDDLLNRKNDDFWVLYAPTYRENKSNTVDVEKLVDIFERKYKRNCKILVREHPKMDRKVKYNFGSKIIDVSNYSDVQELLVSADVLITDYSSIMWDFSLQKKPVFLFHPDKDLFMIERGFYLEFSELPYIEVLDMNSFEDAIFMFDEKEYIDKLVKFFEKYGSYDDGHASERVAKIISNIVKE